MLNSRVIAGGIGTAVILGLVTILLSNPLDSDSDNPVEISQDSDVVENESRNFYIDENGTKHYVVDALDSIRTGG